MVNAGSWNLISEKDSAAEVAEFIRIKGVTRCPTACVLPTQGSVADADREALGAYVALRAARRRTRAAAQAQQFWNVEVMPSEH